MPISSSGLFQKIFHSLITSGAQWRGALWAPPIALVASGCVLAADTLTDTNAQIFLEGDLAKVICNLEEQRTPALSEEGKLRVIRTLPRKGAITKLSASQGRKVRSLQPLIGPAEHPTYEVKVIDVPQAFCGLYQRAVLLISAPALAIWDAEELQAIVAHELGHEYVWQQYETALHERQAGRLKQLELYCDAIAVITLHQYGADPSHLIGALEKAIRYNHNHYGRALNEDDYPTLDQRRQFHLDSMYVQMSTYSKCNEAKA